MDQLLSVAVRVRAQSVNHHLIFKSVNHYLIFKSVNHYLIFEMII